MNPLRRIAAMPPDELRFRLRSGLRDAGARLRWTASRPHWRRASLRHALSPDRRRLPASGQVISALRDGDYGAAHRQLASHFATRASAFPLNAPDLSALAQTIRANYPTAPADAVERAEAMLGGRYDLLGYRGVVFGNPPEWHHDPIHGRRSPLRYWSRMPFLNPAYGDHKIIWELNRHQYWPALGRAHALTGDRRFYDAFTAHLASWLEANPPLSGINWASMLELGFRCLSWLWALELFASRAVDAADPPWLVDLLLALDRQLTHIEWNLSQYFSPNTHLTGEALALYVAGLSLPELKRSARRAALGRAVLLEQAARQIRSDGGHAELSTHYHRYSTDFYLLALVVARRAGDPAATVFEDAVRRQATFLRTVCDDDGIRPAIGDDDGGQLFPICGRPAEDCRDTLTNAVIALETPALGIGPVPEESYWLHGREAGRHVAASTRWTSAALPASGYYVSRTARGDHLVFDAGPHGFLNGGHAHADALAFTLSVAGTPLLIDPGTATYTMDRDLRDRLRTTMMHNALVLDGRSHSQPAGPFHWASRTNADAPIYRSSTDCDYVEGTHAAYRPARHTRAILAVHGLGWWILDHVPGVTGAAADIETYWHLHPSWTCEFAGGGVCQLTWGTRVFAIASSAPLSLLTAGQDPLAFHSPAYGVVEPAPVLRASTTATLPTTIATFIPAISSLSKGLAIDRLPVEAALGDAWHAAAFRVRWQGGAMTLLSAVEADGQASSDGSAPAHRWGTAGLQTDARVALLIDHATRSEAVLVNGSFLTEHGKRQIVSLARRIPLLRLTTSHVAPAVHEVAAG